jgi:hypothetical protein
MINKMTELQKLTSTQRPSKEIIPNDKADPLIVQESDAMNQISALFNEVRQNIARVEENNMLLDQMTDTVQKTVTKESEAAVNAAIKKIVGSNMQFFKKNKELLQLIKGISKMNFSSIIEQNQVSITQSFEGLARQNSDTMQQTLAKEKACEDQMKNKIKRQLRIIDASLDDDQIREIADDPEKVDQILQKSLFGTAHLQIQNYVKDIKEKFDNIKILENVGL